MKVLIGFLMVIGLVVLVTRNHDSLKGNVDYDNGYVSGVTYSSLPKAEAERHCRDEMIQRYAMVSETADGKVASQRFEIGCKDGVKGDN